MSEPRILLESWSPICDVQAFVEESDTCCYLYLWFHPGKEDGYMKSCWICNVGKAPETEDVEAMKSGMAPAMPKKYICHEEGGIRLNADKLELVWYEEGDAAALFEGDTLLCVIPWWSGYQSFNGYARYAVGTAPYAWELKQAEENLLAHIEKCRAFWDYFETPFWEEVQAQHIRTLECFFGKYEKYYAIDGGNFPPKALITGCKEDVCYGITAGVSLMPMPCVEQYFNEDAGDFRRIEMGFAATKDYQEICMKMYSYLSSIAALPWQEISFLAHGHTVPCNAIEGYAAVWLLNARLLPRMDSPVYEDFFGEKINLLWAVPVTDKEYEWLRSVDTKEALQHLAVPLERLSIFDGKGIFDIASA